MRLKLEEDRKVEYERVLADERVKHSNELKEQDNRITELKRAHAQQCDELCREILKANLEADRLHGQLNNGSIRKTDLFFSNSKYGGNRASLPTICIACIILLFVSTVPFFFLGGGGNFFSSFVETIFPTVNRYSYRSVLILVTGQIHWKPTRFIYR